MRLNKYDNKCIKIEDIFGNIYEGNSTYCCREYNLHEFGRDEECLQILNYLFFKDIIKEIIVLENGFTNSYGLLEEEIVEEGIDNILDAFDYEDDEHICRIIRCVKDKKDLKNKKEILNRIKDYLKYNKNKEVLNELNNI